MSFEITSYATHRVKAEAKTGSTSHWVVLTVIEGHEAFPDRSESEITLFFNGPAAELKAHTYAEAINAADRALHPADIAREAAERDAFDREFSVA